MFLNFALFAIAVHFVEESFIAKSAGIVLRPRRLRKRAGWIGKQHLIEDRGIAQTFVESLLQLAVGDRHFRAVAPDDEAAFIGGKLIGVSLHQAFELAGLIRLRQCRRYLRDDQKGENEAMSAHHVLTCL